MFLSVFSGCPHLRLTETHHLTVGRQGGDVLRHLDHRVLDIIIGRNVVAVKHVAGPMAANFHDDGFFHSGTNEVADGGSTAIVGGIALDASHQSDSLTGFLPDLAEIPDRLAAPVKDQGTIQPPRGDAPL